MPTLGSVCACLRVSDRSWVRLNVGGPQTLNGHVRVSLSSGERRVPEQLLHRPQVSAALEHMGCGRVPERMGSDVGAPRLQSQPVDHCPHTTRIDATASDAEEERTA